MTDKERLEEVKSEPFANLEKLKVDILQEKICSGLEDFEQDSKRQWTSLRFEKPLLVKLLSLIKQAERVQELETTVDFYQSALRYADRRVQELEDLVEDYITINKELHKRGKKVRKQNKRYREAIEVAIQNIVACKNLGVKFALKILEQALEGEG